MISFTLQWENVLKELYGFYKKRENLVAYDTYIKQIEPAFKDGNNYFFKSNNIYQKEMVVERFTGHIREHLSTDQLKLGLEPAEDIIVMLPAELDEYVTKRKSGFSRHKRIQLNPFYNFDNFVVGSSNKLANAAAHAIVMNPGTAYNPFFLYGGVGLGKTHLMHAIGNKMTEQNPNINIAYITTETFTNEFIEAIRGMKNKEFREKYRSLDIFLIDDIQFISRAKETQEELFHTFNTLYEANKQIIITSDKHPSDISSVEERLLSRFKSGLLADIGLPDYETRVAILTSKQVYIKKQTNCSLPIDDDVIEYIAQRENTNIRELEGALRSVIAHAQLYNFDGQLKRIDKVTAADALEDFFTASQTKTIDSALIINKVAEYYEITVDDIKGKKKNRSISFPRQVCMYLLRSMLDMTYPDIADKLGGKDHSTIIYADNKIAEKIDKDPSFANNLQDIKSMIGGK